MNEQPATLSPKRPRFTEETLQEIRIADGDGETTVAAYSFTHNGQPAEKVAPLDELTAAEREAALAFILKHAPAAKIKRKKARKGAKNRRYSNHAFFGNARGRNPGNKESFRTCPGIISRLSRDYLKIFFRY